MSRESNIIRGYFLQKQTENGFVKRDIKKDRKPVRKRTEVVERPKQLIEVMLKPCDLRTMLGGVA